MVSRSTKSKTKGATWLSGGRLEEYQRVRKQNYFIAGVIALAFVLIAIISSDASSSLFKVILGLAFGLLLFRIVRGQTYLQFRLKELKYTKQQSEDALKVLMSAKNKPKGSKYGKA